MKFSYESLVQQAVNVNCLLIYTPEHLDFLREIINLKYNIQVIVVLENTKYSDVNCKLLKWAHHNFLNISVIPGYLSDQHFFSILYRFPKSEVPLILTNKNSNFIHGAGIIAYEEDMLGIWFCIRNNMVYTTRSLISIPTIAIKCTNQLQNGVMVHDVAVHIYRTLLNILRIQTCIEIFGDGIWAFDLPDRILLAKLKLPYDSFLFLPLDKISANYFIERNKRPDYLINNKFIKEDLIDQKRYSNIIEIDLAFINRTIFDINNKEFINSNAVANPFNLFFKLYKNPMLCFIEKREINRDSVALDLLIKKAFHNAIVVAANTRVIVYRDTKFNLENDLPIEEYSTRLGLVITHQNAFPEFDFDEDIITSSEDIFLIDLAFKINKLRKKYYTSAFQSLISAFCGEITVTDTILNSKKQSINLQELIPTNAEIEKYYNEIIKFDSKVNLFLGNKYWHLFPIVKQFSIPEVALKKYPQFNRNTFHYLKVIYYPRHQRYSTTIVSKAEAFIGKLAIITCTLKLDNPLIQYSNLIITKDFTSEVYTHLVINGILPLSYDLRKLPCDSCEIQYIYLQRSKIFPNKKISLIIILKDATKIKIMPKVILKNERDFMIYRKAAAVQ